MTLEIALLVSVAIVVIGVLFFQFNHYSFLKSQRQVQDVTLASQELEKRLKEFDDYKKRVDALTVKAGFKL